MDSLNWCINNVAARNCTTMQRERMRGAEFGSSIRGGSCARLFGMTLDELTAQLKAVLAGNPGEDLQKNLRATLAAGLSRMDVVSKQEFDVQREMLNVLRAQVDDLTAKVDALEQRKAV